MAKQKPVTDLTPGTNIITREETLQLGEKSDAIINSTSASHTAELVKESLQLREKLDSINNLMSAFLKLKEGIVSLANTPTIVAPKVIVTHTLKDSKALVDTNYDVANNKITVNVNLNSEEILTHTLKIIFAAFDKDNPFFKQFSADIPGDYRDKDSLVVNYMTTLGEKLLNNLCTNADTLDSMSSHSYLDLSNRLIDENSFRVIQVALDHTRLTNINLSNSGVNDQLAAMVGNLIESNQFITRINLQNNPINYDGICSLVSGIGKSNYLIDLNLDDVSFFTNPRLDQSNVNRLESVIGCKLTANREFVKEFASKLTNYFVYHSKDPVSGAAAEMISDYYHMDKPYLIETLNNIKTFRDLNISSLKLHELIDKYLHDNINELLLLHPAIKSFEETIVGHPAFIELIKLKEENPNFFTSALTAKKEMLEKLVKDLEAIEHQSLSYNGSDYMIYAGGLTDSIIHYCKRGRIDKLKVSLEKYEKGSQICSIVTRLENEHHPSVLQEISDCVYGTEIDPQLSESNRYCDFIDILGRTLILQAYTNID